MNIPDDSPITRARPVPDAAGCPKSLLSDHNRFIKSTTDGPGPWSRKAPAANLPVKPLAVPIFMCEGALAGQVWGALDLASVQEEVCASRG